jgi:hypothetical protein
VLDAGPGLILITMKRFDMKSAVIGTFVTFSVAAATDNRTAWEYQVVMGRAFQDELGKAINSSVSQVWEFVSASGPNNENWPCVTRCSCSSRAI